MPNIFSTHLTTLNDVCEVRPLDGNPSNIAPENLAPVTLGWLCRFVLGTELPEDRTQSGDEKIDRIALALRLPRDDDTEAECELTMVEKHLLTSRIERACSAVHTYRALQLLDPERVKRRSNSGPAA